MTEREGYEREVYLVTLPGKAFYCEVEMIVGQRRWIFTSTDRMRYVGPPWTGPLSPEEIQQIVGEWWTMKKALGQAD